MIEKNLYAQNFQPFKYKTIDDLRNEFRKLELDIPIDQDCEILKDSIKIGNFLVPNRLAVQPMEGYDADSEGSPGDLTLRRYERYAKGGAGIIWFEATAISPEGKSNQHQLYLSEKNVGKFKSLVSTIKSHCVETSKELGYKGNSILILQLNHSGRYSKKNGHKFPIKAYQNPVLDKAMGVSQEDGILLSDENLKALEDLWVEKAILAIEAGFDGVDIKACHGYLISELISSKSRLNSEYGGSSLKNRTKFFFNIISKLFKKLSNKDKFLITSRLGVYDENPYPNGFGVEYNEDHALTNTVDLSEPVEIIKELNSLGVKLINITAGNPYYKPYLTRPFNTPVSGGEYPSEHPLYGVGRIIKLASMIKTNAPKSMVVLGSGYSYLRHYGPLICAGLIRENKIDICGFGRMSIANPYYPRQIFQEGGIDKKLTCIGCSKCTALMRKGLNTGCVIRDDYYKNRYRGMKEL